MAEVRLTSAERAAARALLARYDAGYEANDEWDDEAAPLLRKFVDDLDARDQILKEILDGGEVGDFGALHCIITRATVSRIRVMLGQPDPDEENNG